MGFRCTVDVYREDTFRGDVKNMAKRMGQRGPL